MQKSALFFASLAAVSCLSAFSADESSATAVAPGKRETAGVAVREKQVEITPKAAKEIMKACHDQDNISATTLGGNPDSEAIKAFYKALDNGSVVAVIVIVSSSEMKMCDKGDMTSGVKCRQDQSVIGDLLRALEKKSGKVPSLSGAIALLRSARANEQ